MNRNEAIAYLTQCADDSGNHWSGGRNYYAEDCPTCNGTNDAGWLGTPGSRYGRTSAEVAPIAYRHAVWFARETGQELTRGILSSSMSMAVNDHEGIEDDLREHVLELVGVDIDAVVRGYLACQLWAQLDMDNPSCDCHANDPANACHNYTLDENYDIDDVSAEYVERLAAELSDVIVAHPLAVRMYLRRRSGIMPWQTELFTVSIDASQSFGHDFYLTREGHGTGFWDRGLGELGEYLNTIAKSYGSADELWDSNGTLVS